MPLADLVGATDTILAHWPRKPLRWSHGPSAFRDLLTLEEVEAWMDAECIAMRNLVLLKNGKVLERHTYGTGDMPFPGRVRAHVEDGGTISLRQLQTVKPVLARLRQDIQEETGCLAHINAYLTPPGCQGLKYHYDPYVTLIVQLAGRKTWPLHPPFFMNPTTEYGNFLGRGFTPQQRHFLANTPPASSFTLEPGDVFWLPRGYVHSPYTEGDEPSLHLTFALKERTYHWLAEQIVSDVLAQALVDPAMRQEIPPAQLLSGPAVAVGRMREYLIGALLHLDEEEMGELGRQAALRPSEPVSR